MSKADNMLAILWLLRSGRRMTASQLADELEIHVRTVYRCINSLCASGAPIIADSGPNGGYRLHGTFTEAPLLFAADEQKALVHASTFAAQAGYPFTEALNRAIGKLKHYTNEEQLERIERHREGLAVIHPPTDDRLKGLLQTLEEAAAQGRSLLMEYAGGKTGSAAPREFDPYGIVHWKGSWYAVGYCRLRSETRTFRVDRINRLTPGERRFERPPAFSAADFLMDSLLPGSLRAQELTTVRIRGHERALTELCGHWLFGHALTERRAGEAVFRLGGEALMTYVPYFLLPYGTALTIVEPAPLVERMAAISGGIAAHYGTMAAQAETDGPGATTDPAGDSGEEPSC